MGRTDGKSDKFGYFFQKNSAGLIFQINSDFLYLKWVKNSAKMVIDPTFLAVGAVLLDKNYYF